MIRNLGKFELIEELNSGSMGTVYSARDTNLDRRVAVKTILPGSNLDEELKERFYREARACARLHHPSIVTIYDFGEEQGTAYIAMELLSGTDVRRVIQERRPLPLDVKLDIGAMIVEGLAHAHNEGIIHRDIKPSNIFVTEDGRAKILDFGIARTAASSLTMVGRVLGTPNYMAPEQILGKPCDARSDLFSAAILIYELIGYVHPFQGPSIPKRIVRETADALRTKFPGAPEDVERILAKALAKEPGERYQSGVDFARDLRRAAQTLRFAASHATTSPGQKTNYFEPSKTGTHSRPLLDGEGTEIRMSRVLTSLTEFDDAVEQQNAVSARRAFEVMKNAARGDERFEGAVQRSQERLWDLEKSLPAASKQSGSGSSKAGEIDDDLPAPPPLPKPVGPPPAPASTPQSQFDAAEETVATGPSNYASGSPTMMFRRELLDQMAAPTPAVPAPKSRIPAGNEDPTIGFANPTHTPSRREPEPPPARSTRAAEPAYPTSGGGDATSLFGGGPPPPPRPVSFSPPPAPPLPVQGEPPKRPVTAPVPPVKPVVPAAPVKTASTPQPAAASSRNLILGVAAVVVLLILGAGAYLLLVNRPPKVVAEPFVATARVSAGQTDIVSSPGSAAPTIATAHRGDLLHVLRAPRASTQLMTEVQLVSDAKTLPRGFARTSDLGDWSSTKADVSFGLLRAFAPAPGATESEIQDILAKLDAFVKRFPGTPEASEAHLDMARWNVELARSAAAAQRPPEAFLQAAQDHLSQAGSRQDLAQSIQDVKQDLANFTLVKPGTGTVTPTGGTTPPPALSPAQLMEKAKAEREKGNYQAAIFYLGQVLKAEPGNQEAKDLLDKAKRAKALESGN